MGGVDRDSKEAKRSGSRHLYEEEYGSDYFLFAGAGLPWIFLSEVVRYGFCCTDRKRTNPFGVGDFRMFQAFGQAEFKVSFGQTGVNLRVFVVDKKRKVVSSGLQAYESRIHLIPESNINGERSVHKKGI